MILTYLGFATAHAALFFGGLQLAFKTRRVGTGLVALVAGALIYDNLVQAIGGWVGIGEPLRILNYGRFLLHQLVLPGLIYAGYEIARESGFAWARHPRARLVAILGTLAVIDLGLFTRIVGLTLEPEVIEGITRYAPVEIHGPPFVSILSITFVGMVGFMIWRREGWPWLFWVSVAVFIVEALFRDRFLRLSLGAGVEVLFIYILLIYEQRLLVRAPLSQKQPESS